MLDLTDAPGVVAKVDEALAWFEAAGSRRFHRRVAGVPMPSEIGELINEFDEALTQVSPTEAGVSSERWLRAWQSTRQAADALPGEDSSAATAEAEHALRAVRKAFRHPRRDLVPPADQDEVPALLRKAKISRATAGSGTLDTEPVVVLSGKHERRLELLDARAHRLGYAAPTYRSNIDAREWELRDANGRCLMTVIDTGKRRRFVKRRHYEIHQPDAAGALTVDQTDGRSSAVRDGTADIGVVRLGGRGTTFVIEDHAGRTAARIVVAHAGSISYRVDVAVEVEDFACVLLRKVALATGLIAEQEVDFSGGGGV